jgi:cellulose synthase operon protein C
MKYLLCTCLLLVAFTSLAAAEPSFKEARQLWLTGNYDEAKEQYEQLAKTAKNQPAAAIGLSRTLQSQGEYDLALTTLDEALKEHAKSAPLQGRRAELLFLRGRWEEAEKAAGAAMEGKYPFLARWVVAQIAHCRGDLKKADAEYRWFFSTYNQRIEAKDYIEDPDELLLVGQAMIEYAKMRNSSSLFTDVLTDVYADAIKNDKNFWPAEYQSGLLLLEKFNRGEGMPALDKVLTINPQAAEALAAKGAAALQRFEIKEAEQFAEQALKINANLPEALRLRADVHLAVGDFANALKELARARKINDRDERTLARVAACLQMQNTKPNLENPNTELDKLKASILAFNSKPAVFYYELGERLEDRRYFDQARECYLEAVKLRPGMAGPSNSLGMLYMRLGKEKEAAPLLKKGFEADPFNVRVKNMLTVLRHLEKYETIKTKHYELRFDPKKDAALAHYLSEYLEEIHKDLAAKFAYDPAEPILIELFNNHEMFSGRTIALPDLHTIGACTGRMIAMASPNGAGVPKVFNWARVIRHEIVHIFNLEQTHFLVPHWLTEGLAVNNEGFPRPQIWNQLLLERVPSGELLNLDTIDLGFIRPRSQLEWQMAYCQSQLYVQYLESKYGKPAIGEMLAAYRDGLSTAAAVQKVCKVDKDAFEKGYKDHLQKTILTLKSKPPEKRKSLDQLKKEYEKNPDDIDVAAALAEASLGRSPVEARKLAQKVLDRKKNHPRACLVLARLARLGGDVKQEQELLERGLDRDDPDPKILQALGKMYYDAMDFPKAEDVMELGRKAEPFESKWLELLAQVHALADDKEKLIATLKQLAPADADNIDRRKRLARLLLEAEQFAEAEKYARQALEIDVKDKDVLEMLQKALKGQNKDAEAERMTKLLGK